MSTIVKCFILFLIFETSSVQLKAWNRTKKFEIFGVFKGIGNAKVYLGNKGNGLTQVFKVNYYDSTISKNDTFYFTGFVKDPSFYSIEVPSMSPGWLHFVMENTKYTIFGSKDSIWKATVNGSHQTEVYTKYRNQINVLSLKNNEYVASYLELQKSGDIARANDCMDSIRQLKKLTVENQIRSIKEYPSDFVSLYLIQTLYDNSYSIDSLKIWYLTLSAHQRKSELGQELNYKLFKFNSFIRIGNYLKDLDTKDTIGAPINLEDFKGKYTLLNFWASWCRPCIAEIPDLLKMYHSYHKNKFVIYSISLDTEAEKWKKAIRMHSMPWHHGSDLLGSDSPIYKKMNIGTIPSNYLIGPEGKMIQVNAPLPEIMKYLDIVLK